MNWFKTRKVLSLWEAAELLEPNPRHRYQVRSALAEAVDGRDLRPVAVQRHDARDEFGNAIPDAGALDDMHTTIEATELHRWCVSNGIQFNPTQHEGCASVQPAQQVCTVTTGEQVGDAVSPLNPAGEKSEPLYAVAAETPEAAALPRREPVQQRNVRWLAKLDTCVAGAKSRSDDPRPRGVLAKVIRQIAASEGMKEGTVRKALQEAEKKRIAGYRGRRNPPAQDLLTQSWNQPMKGKR